MEQLEDVLRTLLEQLVFVLQYIHPWEIRNFGALQFRRLLKSYILGGGHKIPMQRGSCVKEAEGECVVPISDKKLPDLVDPNFDEAKDTETGIMPLIWI